MTDRELRVHNTLAAINKTWRENRPEDMRKYLHPEVTMVFPGFKGALSGRDNLIDGFGEFCANARVIDYEESDEQISVVDTVAIASFRFTMLYERTSYSERSEGRDVWVFEESAGEWIAVWRTMTDVKEIRTQKTGDRINGQ